MTAPIAPIPFEKRRFESAAAFYRDGRPAYAPALIRRVAQLAGLGPGDCVLDLGCGPGQLAHAFAPLAAAVTAIDPEPEMLRLAAEAAPANVTLIEGSSYDLSPALGRFRLVTIGRAFHWMDRVDTLRRLEPMMPADGTIALFSDRHPTFRENAWRADYRALLERYSAPGSWRARRDGPGWVRHETVLLDSAFCHLERIGVIERRRTAVATLVRRALSQSGTSPGRIGEAAAAELAAGIEAALAPHATDAHVTEVVETYAVLASRAAR